jgi:hypothetical protein
MEQKHDILINKNFTGFASVQAVQTTSSILQYENKYYFNPTGESVKLVDFSNVRSFLSNKNNEKAVQSYYSFLSSSPLMNSALLVDSNTTQFIPTAEFKSIYYDDERLAESFNNFYNSSILRGLDSDYTANPNVFNTSIRNQFLPGIDFVFTAQSIFHNYYYWESSNSSSPAHSPLKSPFTNAVLDVYGGDRDTNLEERIVEIPSDLENYFINVFLTKKFTQTAKIAFDMCSNTIYKTLVSPVIFSQNLNDITRYNDYLSTTKKDTPKGIDKTPIKSIDYIGNLVFSETLTENTQRTNITASTGNNQTIITKTLIQCFVDPNFKTNENEVWNDNHFNLTNPLIVGEMEKVEIAEELLMETETGTSQTISANTTDVQADISIEEQEDNSAVTNIQINELLTNTSTEEQVDENNSEIVIDNSISESSEDSLV